MNQIKEMIDKYDREAPVANKFNIEIMYEAVMGNPNGDPDSENLPRIDEVSSIGLVTDVCIKNKLRKFVLSQMKEAVGYRLYITNDKLLNEKHREAYLAIGETPKDKKLPKDVEKAKQIKEFMCKNFWDIRTFGAMMSTEVNCGQIRGPVQITFAKSVDSVEPTTITISRQALTAEGDKDKENTLGTKTYVPYGLYRQRIYINPGDAAKTGFTYGDLELLLEAIFYMFEIDRAASRGEVNLRKLVVFEHSNELGDCTSLKIENSLSAVKKVDIPRSYSDYDIILDTTNLPSVMNIVDVEVS